jgi:hypothetical protein
MSVPGVLCRAAVRPGRAAAAGSSAGSQVMLAGLQTYKRLTLGPGHAGGFERALGLLASSARSGKDDEQRAVFARPMAGELS